MRKMMTDITMVLDRNEGLSVRAKAGDSRREEKLLTLVAAYESSHNIPPGKHLPMAILCVCHLPPFLHLVCVLCLR